MNNSIAKNGTYYQLLQITNLAVSIFSMGLPGSINFFINGDTKIDDKKFISVYFTFSTVICIVVDILSFSIHSDYF